MLVFSHVMFELFFWNFFVKNAEHSLHVFRLIICLHMIYSPSLINLGMQIYDW